MPEQKLEVGMWVRSITRGIGKIIDIGAGIEIPRGSAKIWHSDTESSIVSMNNLTLLRAPGEFYPGDEVEAAAPFDGSVIGRRFIITEPDRYGRGWYVDGAPYISWWESEKLRLITPVEARGEQVKADEPKPLTVERVKEGLPKIKLPKKDTRTIFRPRATCNKCDGTGILHRDQVPEDVASKGLDDCVEWIIEMKNKFIEHGCSCHIAPPCGACVEYRTDAEVCECYGPNEPSYFPPDDASNLPVEGYTSKPIDDEPAGAKYFRLQREAESAASEKEAHIAKQMREQDLFVRMAMECVDESDHKETRAERILRHFGRGTGEPSVNRRNGTIGGRQG